MSYIVHASNQVDKNDNVNQNILNNKFSTQIFDFLENSANKKKY